ncbi:MAG: hypothetical protein E6Q67_03130 [Roseateles sp.]|nr:MAG: hypothetical protein E6Q67_03130 [Roseateles sp.]
MNLDITGMLNDMAAVTRAFWPMLSALGVVTGLVLIGQAGKLLVDAGGPNSQHESVPIGFVLTKTFIGAMLLSFMRSVNMAASDLLAGAGADARTTLAYYAPANSGGGIWGLVLNVCFLWVGVMGACAIFRGLYKWHAAGSGKSQTRGDDFWSGLWHIVFGGIAVNMGRFV